MPKCNKFDDLVKINGELETHIYLVEDELIVVEHKMTRVIVFQIQKSMMSLLDLKNDNEPIDKLEITKFKAFSFIQAQQGNILL